MMPGTIFSHAEIHKQDEMKKGQYDDRIIEAHWDLDQQAWRFMRIRDDEPGENHISLVESIINMIIEPVHQEDVCVLP